MVKIFAIPANNDSETKRCSCPGVQPPSILQQTTSNIADSAPFANSADRFVNNFASDNVEAIREATALIPRLPKA